MFFVFFCNLPHVTALCLITMDNYLGEFALEYKFEAGDVVGETPKNCNFRSSGRVQGPMVEVVEFKSHHTVFSSFSATKCGGKTSRVFSHSGFLMGSGIINLFLFKYLVSLCSYWNLSI